MGELWRRIYYLLNRSRLERELRDEMAAHRELLGEDAPRFGNTLRLREEARDAWGWAWWDRLTQDLVFAARILRKSPAFTLTAVAVLAVGVGLNLAGFQVLNAIAWRPLPVSDPDTLVRFQRRSPSSTGSSFAYPVLAYYREHATVLTAAMGILDARVALEGMSTRDVSVEFVTPNYFRELGGRTAQGRLLDPDNDGRTDAEPVVVLSHALWSSRFGASPEIVGRTIRINGRPFTVVGVAGESFVGLSRGTPSAWLPISTQPYAFPGSDALTNFTGAPVDFYGRLSPGVTVRGAEDGLRGLAATLSREHPGVMWKDEYVGVLPAGRFVTLNEKTAPVIALASAFTIVLLLAACANLGTLMLARGISREREIAIRLSVGATRGRIIRQLLTESALLAALGTAAGLALSATGARVFLAYVQAPSFLQPQLDFRVLACGLLLGGLAVAMFGAAPALQAIKLRSSRARARSVLLAVQVAAGCVLLVVSGLLLRGLHNVANRPLGFDYTEHIVIDPGLTANGFKPAAARAYWTDLRGRVESAPRVTRTALTSLAPLGRKSATGRNPNGTIVYFHEVEPSLFDVMGIPLLAGRRFEPGEAGVAVVSESFARAVWPGRNPLGQTHDDHTVVGVSGNAATLALNSQDVTEFYRPIRERDLAEAVMIVRVDGDPVPALPAIVAAARATDPRVAPSVATLQDGFDEKVGSTRRLAAVVGALGGVALTLAAIGFAGLLAFTVSQRTREIAICIALGARPPQVARAVLRQFAVPVGCGVAAGMVAAALLSMALRRELLGISYMDPISYAGAVAVFVLTALASAAGPIRKAIRVAPIDALRCQ